MNASFTIPAKRLAVAAWMWGCVLLVGASVPCTGQNGFGLGGQQEGVVYRTIDHAHNNQLVHEGNIRRLIGEVKAIEAELAGIVAAINNLDALIAEKARDMDEFRRGEYCTKCGWTRTQLETGRHGSDPPVAPRNATDHFQEFSLNGVAAIPTAEEIALREKGHDDRIAAKRAELAGADFRKFRLANERSSRINSILNYQGTYWADAVVAEIDLRQKEWETTKKNLQLKITQVTKLADDASIALNRARANPKTDRASIDTQQLIADAYRFQVRSLQEELPTRRAEAARALDSFLIYVGGVKNNLADLGATVSNDRRFGLWSGRDIEAKFRGMHFAYVLSFVAGNPFVGLSATPIGGLSQQGNTPADIKRLLEGGGTSASKPARGNTKKDAKDVLDGKE